MTTIMAVGAHPDDIEIGGGGVLAKTIQDGGKVICVDLTDGEPTPRGNHELRKIETAKANESLGVTERVCLNLPNRLLMDTEDARLKLGTLMRKHRPDIVLGHVELDAHPDHVASFHITRGAILMSRIVKIDLPHEPWRPRKFYSFICSHLRHAYDPTFIVEIPKDIFEKKITAVSAYESQFGEATPNNHVADMIATRMKYFGSLIRKPYGEAYMCDEPPGVSDIASLL